MKVRKLHTVAETPEFIKQAKALWDEDTHQEFISFISQNPIAGDLISETGGARKIRWAVNSHKGKRGGARIIYYYHNHRIPVFLFKIYAKNQKDNLTLYEKQLLHNIIQLIVKTYKERLI